MFETRVHLQFDFSFHRANIIFIFKHNFEYWSTTECKYEKESTTEPQQFFQQNSKVCLHLLIVASVYVLLKE